MKCKFLILAVVSFMIISMTGCNTNDELLPGDTQNLKKAVIQEPSYNMVPGEMIIKFKDSVADSKKNEIFGKFKGQQKEKILTKMMEKFGDKEGITLAGFSGDVAEAIAKVKGLPEVEYAEPNYIYTHDATSTDPYYTNGSLWGMYGDGTTPANQYGSQAGEAWAAGHTGANTVYVGIIDEGYMYTHEDLSANAGTNPGEIAGNKIDDDKNGYVDDVYGWDFDGRNNTVFDGVNDDHGTHVAGTIGAVGGNGKGVAGVCWTVKLLDAKFLGNAGGTTANAVKAVDYFTNLKTRTKNPVNIVALNNSWGGGGYSLSLFNAIQRANNADILFIAAAGNDGRNIETTPSYPASYTNPNIIAVAALAANGTLASWSNYGATSVDLGAPGVGVWSTVPVKSGSSVVSGYASYSGTSMATPHVTGAAALYAARNPGVTAAAIKSAILTSAVPTTLLSGKCVTGDRLDVSGF